MALQLEPLQQQAENIANEKNECEYQELVGENASTEVDRKVREKRPEAQRGSQRDARFPSCISLGDERIQAA